MQIKTAEFLMSNQDYRNCPQDDIPEIAFIGRSNVGKSSLINMLTNNSNLAKTSSVPGKTQLINHFIIDKSWYLVDLPGFGYAKVSKTVREKFKKMLEDYILKRPNLVCLFVLVDSRIPAQKIDFKIVFTKTDKLGVNALKKNIEDYKLSLEKYWENLPDYFITSSTTKRGKEELLDYIESIL